MTELDIFSFNLKEYGNMIGRMCFLTLLVDHGIYAVVFALLYLTILSSFQNVVTAHRYLAD